MTIVHFIFVSRSNILRTSMQEVKSMYEEELQAIHDAIWEQIYQRQNPTFRFSSQRKNSLIKPASTSPLSYQERNRDNEQHEISVDS
ncbi:MAG: hypothetical protein JWO53_393 [Chlamydiia bacterium]|nr:hypothetical protein [Chlamydiia bacterium]